MNFKMTGQAWFLTGLALITIFLFGLWLGYAT